MKRLTQTIALALLFSAAFVTRAEEKLYALVAYMHVPIERSDSDYIALEKLWQRMHQKAVDSGFCRGWSLYKVENGGANQYATVELYDSLDKIPQRWPDSIFEGLYNDEEMATMRKTGTTRDLTRQDIWAIEAATVNKSKDAQPDHLVVQFIQVKSGQGRNYYSMEKDIYSKIHQARVDAGLMRSWQWASRLLGGTESKFNFVTLNGWTSKGPAWDNKLAESAVGKEALEKTKNRADLRTIVRQEIWRPVLRTTDTKKVAAN